MSRRAAKAAKAKVPAPFARGRESSSDRRRNFAICAALLALTLVAYGQAIGFDFVAWDDPAYVSENPNVREGLSGRSIAWAFTSVHGGHWHPLTSMSHMLDCQIYGLDASGHHLTNLLLHLGNVLLLFAALEAMTRAAWASAFVAALFAVHPLHVETVVWISDRKDLLSTFFGFAALGAYVVYARRRDGRAYALALVLFGLGLMAKATLLTLPVLFLLLDYWPLDRWRERPRIIVEKLPFAGLAAASAAVTAFVVRDLPESLQHGARVALVDRTANAVVSYVRYLAKTIWPSNLAILYPHPNLPGGTPWAAWQIAVAALLLIATSAAVIRGRGRRYLAVGWLWYLVTLLPVIGIVQVGPQAMADRYTYVSLVGLFLIVAWGGADLMRALPRRPRAALAGAGAVVLIACVAGSWMQARSWRDSELLYTRALEVAPRSPLVHTNLGILLRARGQTDAAIDHLRAAIAVDPDLPQTQYALANALVARNEPDLAIEHYRRAVDLDPRFVLAQYNLARTLHMRGRSAEAVDHYRKAVSVRPDFVEALNDLGYVLHVLGRLDEAVDSYRRALLLRSEPRIHRNLARALAAQGKTEEAAEHWRRAGGS
jgi:tetratricopeptide (TPR) repeat protein